MGDVDDVALAKSGAPAPDAAAATVGAASATETANGDAHSKRYGGGTRMKESRCRFCRRRVTRVDYKDILTLQALCRGQGRIAAGKRAGNCARHQRMVKRAIKQARFIGFLSYTEGPGGGGGARGRAW